MRHIRMSQSIVPPWQNADSCYFSTNSLIKSPISRLYNPFPIFFEKRIYIYRGLHLEILSSGNDAIPYIPIKRQEL